MTETDNKNSCKKVKDFRVWTQSKNLKAQNVTAKVNEDQKTIKLYTSILNEEEIPQPKPVFRPYKRRDYISSIIPTDIEISDQCRRMLNDIYKKINKMKDGAQEIFKINSIYLKETSEEYLKESTLSKANFGIQHVTPPLPKLTKNKKCKPINYVHINDKYRRKLNKAFMTFNPLVHLANINNMKKESTTYKQNMEHFKNQINEELKNITSKTFYKKKYEKIRDENEKQKEKNKYTPSMTVTQTKGMNKTSSTGFKSLSTTTRTGFLKKTRANSPVKKKIPEQKEREFELMQEALEIIGNTLDVEPIKKYIGDYKVLKGNYEEREKKYFPELGESEAALKKITLNKIGATADPVTITKEVDYENSMLMRHIQSSKGRLLNDIEKIDNLNNKN